jgi:hypothetical protein
MVVFCENHEKRRRGKKRAFAFFHIEIIPPFFSLLFFNM